MRRSHAAMRRLTGDGPIPDCPLPDEIAWKRTSQVDLLVYTERVWDWAGIGLPLSATNRDRRHLTNEKSSLPRQSRPADTGRRPCRSAAIFRKERQRMREHILLVEVD